MPPRASSDSLKHAGHDACTCIHDSFNPGHAVPSTRACMVVHGDYLTVLSGRVLVQVLSLRLFVLRADWYQ